MVMHALSNITNSFHTVWASGYSTLHKSGDLKTAILAIQVPVIFPGGKEFSIFRPWLHAVS